MTTCLDKLMKKLQGPIPEDVLGKISVSVSIKFVGQIALGPLNIYKTTRPFCNHCNEMIK